MLLHTWVQTEILTAPATFLSALPAPTRVGGELRTGSICFQLLSGTPLTFLCPLQSLNGADWTVLDSKTSLVHPILVSLCMLDSVRCIFGHDTRSLTVRLTKKATKGVQQYAEPCSQKQPLCGFLPLSLSLPRSAPKNGNHTLRSQSSRGFSAVQRSTCPRGLGLSM